MVAIMSKELSESLQVGDVVHVKQGDRTVRHRVTRVYILDGCRAIDTEEVRK